MQFSQYTTLEVADLERELNTSAKKGLSEKLILNLRKQFGWNQLKSEQIKWWHILLRQFQSSFVYLLLVATLIVFVLGEYIEASMILLFILIDTGLGFYQEYHSEKTVKLLKKFINPTVKVRRGGKEIVIESHELVPGDLITIETGDLIPADIRFIAENNLIIDESILTGESVQVRKIITPLAKPVTEIYQAENIGFCGTHVVCGQGQGLVIATGNNLIISEISRLTQETARVSSFEKGVGKLSNFILKITLATLLFVVIANLIIKGPRVDFYQLIIFAIALAVSIIPEALPVVMTFSLSRGAARLAKNKVVVKRLSAVEDLGGIDILCTDKTGTITENNLAVVDVFNAGSNSALFYSAIASSVINKIKQANNSFDLAIYKKISNQEKENIKKVKRIAELPFDPDRRRNSILVEYQDKKELIVRGAAESILAICSQVSVDRKKINQWLIEEGKKGRRVLAVAAKKINNGKAEYDITAEEQLEFIGLISFVDPIKKTTFEAVKKAQKMGVQIKIITGDSVEVAGAVGKEIGLIKDSQDVITGEELDKLNEATKIAMVKKYNVFARVSPQQKYNIIKLLENGNEVGFLGEGINDAPALKIANVSLVVSGASDIARDAADIILLNKSLLTIINGISEGRQIFANTVKYIKITLISNFGNFFAVASASLIIDFLPMLPLQILLLNLLSDFPMIAIASDNVDEQELKKPKAYNIKEIALIATVLGLISTIFDFMFFAIFYRLGPGILQTNWFIGSILTELILIYSIRTKLVFFKAKRPGWLITCLTAGAALITIIIPFTKIGHQIFKFISPDFNHLLTIFIIVIAYFGLTELVKHKYYGFVNHDQI